MAPALQTVCWTRYESEFCHFMLAYDAFSLGSICSAPRISASKAIKTLIFLQVFWSIVGSYLELLIWCGQVECCSNVDTRERRCQKAGRGRNACRCVNRRSGQWINFIFCWLYTIQDQCFFTNSLSRFASVVFNAVLEPTRQVQCTLHCTLWSSGRNKGGKVEGPWKGRCTENPFKGET